MNTSRLSAPPVSSFVLALALATTGCGAAAVQADAGAASPASPASVSAAASPGAPGINAVDVAHGVTAQKIVRDARMDIEVSEDAKIAPVIARARGVATKLGGYVSSESNASIVFKVPSPKLDEALDDVVHGGAKGEHVARREVTAKDVTSEYTDLAIRIDNARKLASRLKELESQTSDVAKLLELEREISRVTTELEQLEGQMRLMDSQTMYATATIDVDTPVKPGPMGWVFVGLYKGVKWLFVWS